MQLSTLGSGVQATGLFAFQYVAGTVHHSQHVYLIGHDVVDDPIRSLDYFANPIAIEFGDFAAGKGKLRYLYRPSCETVKHRLAYSWESWAMCR